MSVRVEPCFALLLVLLSVTACVDAIDREFIRKGYHQTKRRRTLKEPSKNSTTTARNLQNGIRIPDWGYPGGRGGSAGVDWAYQSVNYGFDSTNTGMSYYIRAFDMFPKHYTSELGWGQWISPSYRQDAGSSCPLNPHTIMCMPLDGPRPNMFNNNNYNAKACSFPAGDSRLQTDCVYEQCDARSARDEYIVYGTLEGGMGYWPYTTGHNGVKWMTPASVSGSYNKFGGQYVAGVKQPVCI